MTYPAAPPPAQLYVYYTLGAPREEALHRIAAMLADVEARTGVAGRLLMRRDDTATWMEVYANLRDVDGFRAVLAQAVERHGAAAVAREGARHVECFVPVLEAQDR